MCEILKMYAGVSSGRGRLVRLQIFSCTVFSAFLFSFLFPFSLFQSRSFPFFAPYPIPHIPSPIPDPPPRCKPGTKMRVRPPPPLNHGASQPPSKFVRFSTFVICSCYGGALTIIMDHHSLIPDLMFEIQVNHSIRSSYFSCLIILSKH